MVIDWGIITSAFQDYFEGRINAEELDQRLTKIVPQGTSERSLFVPDNVIQISKIL